MSRRNFVARRPGCILRGERRALRDDARAHHRNEDGRTERLKPFAIDLIAEAAIALSGRAGGGDATGKVGIDASDQRRRNDRATLELIRRLLRDNTVRKIAELLEIRVEEVFLGALGVGVGVAPPETGAQHGSIEVGCCIRRCRGPKFRSPSWRPQRSCPLTRPSNLRRRLAIGAS